MFAEHELHKACRVLFGSDIQVSNSFLEYLQLSGVKSAYRKRALETHPDKIITLQGSPISKSADLFMAVQQAYESLICYMNARQKGYSFQPSQREMRQRSSDVHVRRPAPRPNADTTARAKNQQWQSKSSYTKPHDRPKPSPSQASSSNKTVHRSASMYQGPIPSRKLLFGHYLYYSGVTTWPTIIKALIWQRTKRPRIGEIGCRFGWLSNADILTILQGRSLRDSFGKSAIELGFLTEQQLQLIIFQQKKLQKKFGDFFVAHNLLSPVQLNQLVRQFRSHNLAMLSNQAKYRTM